MKLQIKYVSILFLLILTIGVYGYFKAVPPAQKQSQNFPEIKVSPNSFDFGEANYGEVLNYTFSVKNQGKGILEIKRVSTSCACTTAKIAKEKIEPGQETQLLVTYDTGAMSGSHAKGRQERIIYIKSNDPINPQVEVVIYAKVN